MDNRFWRELDEAQHASAVAWVCSADEMDSRPGETDEVYPLDRGVGARATQRRFLSPSTTAPAHPRCTLIHVDTTGRLWYTRCSEGFTFPVSRPLWSTIHVSGGPDTLSTIGD